MSHEAIVHDDVARARKLQSQEQTTSENHTAIKSDFKNKNEITLKGGCMLATKCSIHKLIASTSVSYALVCKDALFSLHDMQHSLPPIVSNIL